MSQSSSLHLIRRGDLHANKICRLIRPAAETRYMSQRARIQGQNFKTSKFCFFKLSFTVLCMCCLKTFSLEM